MNYESFKEMLERRVASGNEIFEKLLRTVINSPERYCGIFRLTNAKSKLVQNLTQSQEIKFGDFLEELVTEYIKNAGFRNMNKNLNYNNEGSLVVDQYFKDDDDTIYFVEQKIRDDHDSKKMLSEFDDVVNKYDRIKLLNPESNVIGYMWFIDDSFRKNRNYYARSFDNHDFGNDEVTLVYGDEFFNAIGLHDEWIEILSHLQRMRDENIEDVIDIPDFDTSEVIYLAMVNLPKGLWNKLNSNLQIYQTLRSELFPTGFNIERAREERARRGL